MPAYVIQYEPFLLRLDTVLTGVTLKNPRQVEVLKVKGEAFCDDNGIASTSMEDLSIFDSTCRRYEASSCGKLSRNKKSKILFSGRLERPSKQTRVAGRLSTGKGGTQSLWIPGDRRLQNHQRPDMGGEVEKAERSFDLLEGPRPPHTGATSASSERLHGLH